MNPRKRLMFKNRAKARREAIVKAEEEITKTPIAETVKTKVEDDAPTVNKPVVEAVKVSEEPAPKVAPKTVEKPKVAAAPTLKTTPAKKAPVKKAAAPSKTAKKKTTKKTS